MPHYKACLVVALIILSGCAHVQEKPYRIAPAVLPATTDRMRCPGYWVSLIPEPDKIIMTAPQIEAFNRRTRDELALIHDVATIGAVYSGPALKKRLDDEMASLEKKHLYLQTGVRAARAFYCRMSSLVNIQSIPDPVNVRYAFVVSATDQRLLPTDECLYASPGDIEFDELQNSGLDIGEPAAVMHETSDGVWCYTITPLSEGWVRKSDLAFCAAEDILDSNNSGPRAVVVSRQADIFSDQALRKFVGTIRMGVSLPISDARDERCLEVSIPSRSEAGLFIASKGYVSRDDVNIGHLDYTQRAIIEQAFKLLDAPYGWGDMRHDADCSRLLQEVFATVGIIMPRNSGAQGQVGMLLWNAEPSTDIDKKTILIENGMGGVTTLQLKGHIMLYLGSVCGEAYAIHALWAYREPGMFGDKVRVTRRVVVTGLDLGKGSRKGSLLERIVSMRLIKN